MKSSYYLKSVHPPFDLRKIKEIFKFRYNTKKYILLLMYKFTDQLALTARIYGFYKYWPVSTLRMKCFIMPTLIKLR